MLTQESPKRVKSVREVAELTLKYKHGIETSFYTVESGCWLNMVIKEKIVNGMHVLILTGKLDIFSRNSFRDTIEEHKQNGAKGLIIDLQGVSFIDSIGIGALVLAAKTFQGIKGKVILVNPQDIVKTALQAMNLSAILPIFDTDSEYSTFSQPA